MDNMRVFMLCWMVDGVGPMHWTPFIAPLQADDTSIWLFGRQTAATLHGIDWQTVIPDSLVEYERKNYPALLSV